MRSASLGFPFDGFLRIEDSNGKQVARDDDAGEASDPLLNWKFANDGTYVLVLNAWRAAGASYLALDRSSARRGG